MESFGEAFPGNSHTAKQSQQNTPPEKPAEAAPEETPTVKKIVSGKVTQKQKPLGERFKTMFFADNFIGHMTEKVVVPKVKDLAIGVLDQFFDAIRDGIQEAITGEPRPRGARPSYGTGRPVYPATNYSKISSAAAQRVAAAPRIIRRANIVQDIFLESREDADMVLEELAAVVDGMGHCTVGDLYGMLNISHDSTHQSWGWDILTDARIRFIPSTQQYKLVLPPPIPIEN